MPQTHHFILVHGAYHQPAHWSPLVTLLQASGHQTSTPRLPSVSAVPIPNCLAADISSIKTSILDAIASGSDSIVPILHSYGGIPGFEAIATLTDEEKSKITRVICISAFIIPKGESLVSVQKPDSRNYVEITGPTATVPSPIAIFYNDVEPGAAEHAASLLLPHVLEAFFTPTQHDGCADFPVTYILCTKDEALTVSYQREAIEVCKSREGRKGGQEAVEVVEMESGHSPFLSMPEETKEFILRTVGGAS